jgi:hypothetical protein
MGYDKYKDTNGVTWTITPSDALVATGGITLTMQANYQWKMMAYVRDEDEVGYAPPAPDLVATMPAPMPGATANAEQTRNIFIDLTSQIEGWAKEHRHQVTLRVTASAGSGWLLILAGAWLLYEVLGGKRRR